MSNELYDFNIGHSTAYAYAKASGDLPEGMTPEEYGELLAAYATVGQTAVTAAQTATTKASEAATSATTATNKATEATTAATTATTKAGEASTSASTATSAKDTAVSASQTATTKATEATTAAATATSAATTATTAKDDAVSAKTAAQAAQTGAETAAASVSASAAQIATNTDDITQLKSELSNISEPSVNLYNYKTRTDATGISSTGAISTSSTMASYSVSDYISVEAGKTLYFSVDGVTWGARRLNGYDANRNLLVGYPIENPTTFIVPSDVKFIRFSGTTTNRMDYIGTQLQYNAITASVPYDRRTIKKSALLPQFVNLNTTRYISNNGSDDNNGLTALTPFKTFAKAIADGAETLFIEADEYSENIVQQVGRPLKIRPYNGNEIVLKDTGAFNYMVYARFSDIDIVGVKCQGTARYGFIFEACNGVLKNCTATSNGTMGFCLDGSNVDLYNCLAKTNGTDGFNAHTFTNSGVDYTGTCRFYGCIADGNGDDGLSFHETNDFCVYGGEYTNNVEGGVVPYGESIAEVYNAVISGNAQGLYAFSDSASARQKVKSFGNLIINNTIGVIADYYKITSVNDVVSNNTTNTLERNGGEISKYAVSN